MELQAKKNGHCGRFMQGKMGSLDTRPPETIDNQRLGA